MNASVSGNNGPVDEVTFRNCTHEDFATLLQLWRDSGSLPTATDSEEAFITRLRRDNELFVVAFVGDRLAGCIMGGWDGWRANMYRLAVLPGYRRRSIGKRLVRLVEERLRGLGASRVYALAVKPELEPGAVEFWQALGYELNPRTLPYVRTLQ